MIEKWLNLLGKKKKEVFDILEKDGQKPQRDKSPYIYTTPEIVLYGVKLTPHFIFFNSILNNITFSTKDYAYSKEALCALRDELIALNFELQSDSFNHTTAINKIDYHKEKQNVSGYQNENELYILLQQTLSEKEMRREALHISQGTIIRWLLYLLGGVVFGIITFFTTLNGENSTLSIWLSVGSGLAFALLYGLFMELSEYFSTRNIYNKKKKPKLYQKLENKAKEAEIENGFLGVYYKISTKGLFKLKAWNALLSLKADKAIIFYKKAIKILRIDIPINNREKLEYSRFWFSIKSDTEVHNFYFIEKINDEELSKIDNIFGYSGEKYDEIYAKVHKLFIDYNLLSVYDSKDSPYLDEVENLERSLVRKLSKNENITKKDFKDFFISHLNDMEEYYDENEPNLINSSSYYGDFINYLLDHLFEDNHEVYAVVADLQSEDIEKSSTDINEK